MNPAAVARVTAADGDENAALVKEPGVGAGGCRRCV
jgi:hypothetical protein